MKGQSVMITPEEIAQDMGKSRFRVYELLRSGVLPALPNPGGRGYQIPRAAYHRFLRGEPVDPRLFDRSWRKENAA